MREVIDCDEMWVAANKGQVDADAWCGGEAAEAAIQRGKSFLRWLMRRWAHVVALVGKAGQAWLNSVNSMTPGGAACSEGDFMRCPGVGIKLPRLPSCAQVLSAMAHACR